MIIHKIFAHLLKVTGMQAHKADKITAYSNIKYDQERVLGDLDLVNWGRIKDWASSNDLEWLGELQEEPSEIEPNQAFVIGNILYVSNNDADDWIKIGSSKVFTSGSQTISFSGLGTEASPLKADLNQDVIDDINKSMSHYEVKTINELRGLSENVINKLESGQYKYVRVLGYYAAGDTPGPINYYLSETNEPDDGGSIIDMGSIKLEHDFGKKDVNIKYFGIRGSLNQSDVDRLNNFDSVVYEGVFNVSESVVIKSKNVYLDLHVNSTDESASIHFSGVDGFEIKRFTFDGKDLSRRGILFTDCTGVFNGKNKTNIINIGHDQLDKEATGVMIRGGCHGFVFKNSRIFNVKSVSVANGIYMGLVNPGDEKPKNVKILGNTIDTILPGADADGIKYLDVNGDDKNLLVEGNIFIDCAKRAMKFQSTGLHSRNNIIKYVNIHSSYAFIDWQGNKGSSINDTVEIYPETINTGSNYLFYIALRFGGSDIYVENFNMNIHSYDLESEPFLNSRILQLNPTTNANYSKIQNITVRDSNFIGQYFDFGDDVRNFKILNCSFYFTGGSNFRGIPGINNPKLTDFIFDIKNIHGGVPQIKDFMINGKYLYTAITNSNSHAVNPVNRDTVDYFVNIGDGDTKISVLNFTIENDKLLVKHDTTSSPENQTLSRYAVYNGSKKGDISISSNASDDDISLKIGHICYQDADSNYPKGRWKELYYVTQPIGTAALQSKSFFEDRIISNEHNYVNYINKSYIRSIKETDRYIKIDLTKPIPQGESFTISIEDINININNSNPSSFRISFRDSQDTQLTTSNIDINTKSLTIESLPTGDLKYFYLYGDDTGEISGNNIDFVKIKLSKGKSIKEWNLSEEDIVTKSAYSDNKFQLLNYKGDIISEEEINLKKGTKNQLVTGIDEENRGWNAKDLNEVIFDTLLQAQEMETDGSGNITFHQEYSKISGIAGLPSASQNGSSITVPIDNIKTGYTVIVTSGNAYVSSKTSSDFRILNITPGQRVSYMLMGKKEN